MLRRTTGMVFQISFLSVTAVLLLAGSGRGARLTGDADSGDDDPETKIEAFLARYVTSHNFSGVVLASHGGDEVIAKGYGWADSELGVPVEAHSRFRVGSVSKSFTAAAVLLLRDRGVLELDEAVARYIGDFPHGDRISVRNLLAHRSGLANLFSYPDYADISRRHYERPLDLVALVAEKELQFDPGTRFAYNNMNYTALAYLIEEVSGVPYGEFVHRELLVPLGMSETRDGSDVTQMVPNLAKPHDPVGMRGLRKSRYVDYSVFTGSGSIVSTAGDLVRWVEGQVGSRQVLGEDSRRDVLEFAWSESDDSGRRVIAAQGWDGVGYSAHVVHFPDEALTVVVLCNLNIARVDGEIARGVSAIILGEEPEMMPLDPKPLPEDSLQALAGKYRFGDDFYVPGGVLDVVARDGELYDVGREPEAGLIPLADGTFLYRPVWARIRFLSDGDGRVTGLRFYDRFVAERAERP